MGQGARLTQNFPTPNTELLYSGLFLPLSQLFLMMMANAGHDSSASRHRPSSLSGTFFIFTDAILPFILNISGQISEHNSSPTQRFMSICTFMQRSLLLAACCSGRV
jgi:hypothetical protein